MPGYSCHPVAQGLLVGVGRVAGQAPVFGFCKRDGPDQLPCSKGQYKKVALFGKQLLVAYTGGGDGV